MEIQKERTLFFKVKVVQCIHIVKKIKHFHIIVIAEYPSGERKSVAFHAPHNVEYLTLSDLHNPYVVNYIAAEIENYCALHDESVDLNVRFEHSPSIRWNISEDTIDNVNCGETVDL